MRLSAANAFTRESKSGSDLSGTDGTTNRTLTLAATPSFVIHIFVSNAALQLTTDYTRSGAVITFLNAVFNDQNIEVVYV